MHGVRQWIKAGPAVRLSARERTSPQAHKLKPNSKSGLVSLCIILFTLNKPTFTQFSVYHTLVFPFCHYL